MMQYIIYIIGIPRADHRVIFFKKIIIINRYIIDKLKNIRSRRKYFGVTLIIRIGGPLGSLLRFEAYVDIAATTVEMNRVPPIIKLIDVEAS